MPRLNYPLKKYQKAVEIIAEEKGLSRVNVVLKSGSIVRFELFEEQEAVPFAMWVIHCNHDKKRTIWSKDDYRKAAVNLGCPLEELMEKLDSL